MLNEEFLSRMRAEIEANNTGLKPRFENWHPDVPKVRFELRSHGDKLVVALANGDKERIREFSADIANLMMKTFEDFG